MQSRALVPQKKELGDPVLTLALYRPISTGLAVIHGTPYDSLLYYVADAINTGPFVGNGDNYSIKRSGSWNPVLIADSLLPLMDGKDFTIEYFMKREAQEFNQYFHTYGTGALQSGLRWGWLNAQGRYGLYASAGQAGGETTHPDITITPGVWHHIAHVVKRKGAPKISFYINGSLIREVDAYQINPYGEYLNFWIGKNAAISLAEIHISQGCIDPSNFPRVEPITPVTA